jgi:hypothetical protein
MAKIELRANLGCPPKRWTETRTVTGNLPSEIISWALDIVDQELKERPEPSDQNWSCQEVDDDGRPAYMMTRASWILVQNKINGNVEVTTLREGVGFTIKRIKT